MTPKKRKSIFLPVIYKIGDTSAYQIQQEQHMSEIEVLPWIEINQLMDDEYRKLVVADALSYYPHASAELNKFALNIFKQAIQLNGFRSFQSIPLQLAKNHAVNEFKVNAALAAAVICLWAEKKQALIETLKNAALEANIPVHKNWSWLEAREGFVLAESIPELDKLATTLAAQKTKPESDHYILASLWLSHSLFIEQAQETEPSQPNADTTK